MSQKTESKKAYRAHQKEINALIEKLKSKLDRHSKQDIGWGHVGDLGHIKEELKNIDEFLNC